MFLFCLDWIWRQTSNEPKEFRSLLDICMFKCDQSSIHQTIQLGRIWVQPSLYIFLGQGIQFFRDILYSGKINTCTTLACLYHVNNRWSLLHTCFSFVIYIVLLSIGLVFFGGFKIHPKHNEGLGICKQNVVQIFQNYNHFSWWLTCVIRVYKCLWVQNIAQH